MKDNKHISLLEPKGILYVTYIFLLVLLYNLGLSWAEVPPAGVPKGAFRPMEQVAILDSPIPAEAGIGGLVEVGAGIKGPLKSVRKDPWIPKEPLQDAGDNLYPDLGVSPPCPNADDIFPCTCMNYSTGRTYVSCDGLTDEKYAYRALHAKGYGADPVASFSMIEGTVKSVSKGLFDEHSFETVFMNDNEIATIEPETLGPLKKDLTMMYLDNNKLTHHIVDQVVGFSTLYELHMSNNLIKNISDMAKIEGMVPQLRVIDLSHNLLEEVPPLAFQSMPNLLMIFLTDNNITYIHPDAFIGLEVIDYLYLDGNHLNYLGSEAVGRIVLTRPIHQLNLASCEIETLLPGFAEGLGDPSSLQLNHNPIRLFPEEVFGDILRNMSISDYPSPYLGIDMFYNWIECGCDFLWVAIDWNLNAHLNGGHCGNSTHLPWVSIDDIDAQALEERCLPTTTNEPQPTDYNGEYE